MIWTKLLLLPQKVMSEYQHRRAMHQLIRGLKRLTLWQSLLQNLLVEIRLRLRQDPSWPLEIPGLPVTFTLKKSTLLWALSTLEDLELILRELIFQAEAQGLEMSQKS